MGCVLFELAAGRKAFNNDFAVLTYDRKETPFVMCFDGVEDQDCISEFVLRMLEIEPQRRPLAAKLVDDFSIRWREKDTQKPDVSARPITDGLDPKQQVEDDLESKSLDERVRPISPDGSVQCLHDLTTDEGTNFLRVHKFVSKILPNLRPHARRQPSTNTLEANQLNNPHIFISHVRNNWPSNCFHESKFGAVKSKFWEVIQGARGFTSHVSLPRKDTKSFIE